MRKSLTDPSFVDEVEQRANGENVTSSDLERRIEVQIVGYRQLIALFKRLEEKPVQDLTKDEKTMLRQCKQLAAFVSM